MLRFWKKHDKKDTVPPIAHTGEGILAVHNDTLLHQLRLIDFTKQDLATLKSYQPRIKAHIQEITDVFYNNIMAIPALSPIIAERTTVERLKASLSKYLVSLFDGVIDEQSLAHKQKIAKIHYNIGLEPKWYMGTFHQLQQAMIYILTEPDSNRDECVAVYKTVGKLISLEIQIVLEEYEKENLRLRTAEHLLTKDDLKEKISAISHELATLTEGTSQSIEKIDRYTYRINTAIQKNVQAVAHIHHNAQHGQDDLSQLETMMATITEHTNEMAQLISQLDTSSTEIISIIALVKSIADQTNLLALNASIEAARAGEHGKGFAVVAQEVRKLAEQSTEAVEQITTLVQTSTSLTASAVDRIHHVEDSVTTSHQTSNEARNRFSKIATDLSNNRTQIGDVAKDIDKLGSTIRSIGIETTKVASTADALHQTASKL